MNNNHTFHIKSLDWKFCISSIKPFLIIIFITLICLIIKNLLFQNLISLKINFLLNILFSVIIILFIICCVDFLMNIKKCIKVKYLMFDDSNWIIGFLDGRTVSITPSSFISSVHIFSVRDCGLHVAIYGKKIYLHSALIENSSDFTDFIKAESNRYVKE
jgi:hypothetical protein